MLFVELNDADALGHYGLSPVLYARMVEAGWDESCTAVPAKEQSLG